jgi:hypothetical protein
VKEAESAFPNNTSGLSTWLLFPGVTCVRAKR